MSLFLVIYRHMERAKATMCEYCDSNEPRVLVEETFEECVGTPWHKVLIDPGRALLVVSSGGGGGTWAFSTSVPLDSCPNCGRHLVHEVDWGETQEDEDVFEGYSITR